MTISKRLQAIAALVPSGRILADVGCDHGYLPIWLIREGILRKAIALDIHTGPLQRAEAHIREAGLTGQIETRLSDGLCALLPGECDTLVIAGMGGPLMERILEDGQELLPGFREMILQPQSDLPHFRGWLYQNGFAILNEVMVKEDGKFYTILKVGSAPGASDLLNGEIPSEIPSEIPTEILLYCGPVLLHKKDPVLREYLEFRLRICRKIEESLNASSGETAKERKREVEIEKRIILTALEGWGKI